MVDGVNDQRQGAGPVVDAYLTGRLAQAKGRVNCDIMQYRLRRSNLRDLLAALEEGVALLRDIIGEDPRDDT